MRTLPCTVALLALTGCMSAAAHRGPSIPDAQSPIIPETPQALEEERTEAAKPAPEADTALTEQTTAKPETVPTPDAEQSAATPAGDATAAAQPDQAAPPPEADDCGAIKNDVQLPLFLKDKPALVVSAKQICKTKSGEKIEPTRTNLSVIGVSCTGAPGLITRRGHSNQNWELVTFGMDMSCQMQPAEDIKTVGKQKLGMETEPQLVSYVPMMIEYWEFETNNDAGLGTRPALTAAGGGAAQWKKNETKNNGFPIKLYGRSSTFTRDQSMYEVDAVLKPRSNQRQFEVIVQNMKQMNSDELKATLERCRNKISPKSGCDEAFTN